MEKKTVKSITLGYIADRRDGWIYGGTLEHAVSMIAKVKPSNVSRVLRKLEEQDYIEKRYVLNPNGTTGNKVVQYKFKSKVEQGALL